MHRYSTHFHEVIIKWLRDSMFAKHFRREFDNQASLSVNSGFTVRQTCYLTLRSVIEDGQLLGTACHKR